MQIHRSAARGDVLGVQRQLERGIAVDSRDVVGLWSTTPLIVAAGSQRAGLDMLRLLLDSGADVNACAESETPLGAAARAGSVDKVHFLLAHGADARAVAGSNFTPLIYAAYGTSPTKGQVIRILLDHGANPDVVSIYNESALSVLSSRGKFELVQTLLDHGADPAPLRWTPMHFAAAAGDPHIVCARATAAPQELTALDGGERTPWLVALLRGDRQTIEMFLELGSPLGSSGRCGHPLLVYPCTHDHHELVRLLVERGADPNATNDFGSPVICEAAESGAAGCVRELIRAGAAISGLKVARKTPATESAHAHFGNILHQLSGSVAAGADRDVLERLQEMNERIMNQPTYWFAITEARNLAVVDELLSAGADIDQIDDTGYSLLKTAAELDDLELAAGLLDRGAAVDNTNIGDTALHKAIGMDHLDIARLLLDRGANPNALDVDGETPLFYVTSEEAVRLLIDRGVDPTIKEDMRGRSAVECLPDDYVRGCLESMTQSRYGRGEEAGPQSHDNANRC